MHTNTDGVSYSNHTTAHRIKRNSELALPHSLNLMEVIVAFIICEGSIPEYQN